MALIKCPECGNEISEFAKACPNCGCPIEFNVELVGLESDKQDIESANTDSVFETILSEKQDQDLKREEIDVNDEAKMDAESIPGDLGNSQMCDEPKKKVGGKIYTIAGAVIVALVIICLAVSGGGNNSKIMGSWHAVALSNDGEITALPSYYQDAFTLDVEKGTWSMDTNDGSTYSGTWTFDEDVTEMFEDEDEKRYWYSFSFNGSNSDTWVIYFPDDDEIFFKINENYQIYQRD